MRIALLHNMVPDDAAPDDRDVLVQVEAVGQALRSLGHERHVLPCTLDLGRLEAELAALRPAVAFNLVESLGGYDRLMILATALLDVLRLPYTGASTEAVFLTTHKLLAKERIRQAGLPTPDWVVARGEDADNVESISPLPLGEGLGVRAEGSRRREKTASHRTSPHPNHLPKGEGTICFPKGEGTFIIKTIAEHASFGLDEGSIVAADTPAALRERLRQHAARLGCACFAEQYIEGREFNLSVLGGEEGPTVLPPAEIDFSAFPAGKPRIVDYRAKWEETCFEYENTPRRFDFPAADQPLLDRLRELAAACWRLFGLRGYARVDFRVDAAGQPWILEINANPCLSPDAGFAAALARTGIGFDQAVQRILDEALFPE